ncbi:MAG: hypothetical protein FD180_382 [Planctomycetota bacterium]|nr:MAG: hypothetical protein FD180_382 [Planctomycetota bacterium]
MSFQVTFEPLGAMYIRFAKVPVYRTIEFVEDEVNIDVDRQKNIIGIEVLHPGVLKVNLRKLNRSGFSLPEEARQMDFGSLEKAFASVGS